MTADRSMSYFCFSFALILLVLTGLTTPVMGTLMRLKTPALPFLLAGAMMMVNSARLKSPES